MAAPRRGSATRAVRQSPKGACMSDDTSIAHSESATNDALQFDRAVASPAAAAVAHDRGVVCAACQTSIPTEYFDLGGRAVCDRCRQRLELAAETPRGALPLLAAGACGLGAGIVGAIIYYSVIAIAHVEIGLVAILIGYMVGYAVRRGAGGRGGLRVQILAIALPSASVGLAYAPFELKAVRDRQAHQAAITAGAKTTTGTTVSATG